VGGNSTQTKVPHWDTDPTSASRRQCKGRQRCEEWLAGMFSFLSARLAH